MQYLTATDSNGIEVCLFQLEGNFFISVPKVQLGLNLEGDKWITHQPEEITKNSLRTDCNGCRFVGTYDTEFPCANCVRKNKDYYCGAKMKGAE